MLLLHLLHNSNDATRSSAGPAFTLTVVETSYFVRIAIISPGHVHHGHGCRVAPVSN